MQRLFGIVSLTLLLLPGLAMAQSPNPCTVTFNDSNATTGNCTITGTNLTATFGRAIRLSFPATTTDLGSPSVSDYNTGFMLVSGPLLTVKGNAGFAVTMSASATTWTGTGTGARANKPRADLLWSKVNGSGYVAIAASEASVLTSATASASTTQQLFYKALLGWTADTPGTYTLNVRFTVTSP